MIELAGFVWFSLAFFFFFFFFWSIYLTASKTSFLQRRRLGSTRGCGDRGGFG